MTSKKIPNFLKNVLSIDLVICGVILCILVALTFLGAFSRYLFDAPFIWLDEIQMPLFLTMVFLGMGAGMRYHEHVAIDILTDLFPKKTQKIISIFIIVVVIAVMGFLFFHSADRVINMFILGRTTSILNIPVALIYSMVPLGCLSMIINTVVGFFYSEDAGE